MSHESLKNQIPIKESSLASTFAVSIRNVVQSPTRPCANDFRTNRNIRLLYNPRNYATPNHFTQLYADSNLIAIT